MQNKTADEMSDFMVDSMVNFFGEKVTDFGIFNINEDNSHKAFCINFKAYDYFIILFSYEKGSFGCSIQVGNTSFIELKNSQKWWDDADIDLFLEELKGELELRIPDKFLKARGWL